MSDPGKSRIDQLFEILVEEVAKRIEARSSGAARVQNPPTPSNKEPTLGSVSPTPVMAMVPEAPLVVKPVTVEPMETPRVYETQPEPLHPSHAAPLMARLAIGILIAVVLINIPINAQGTAIARSIPSSASLVIANGLVVKESNSPDIWVYRDESFHWITTMEAFEYFGYRWQDVHVVEPGWLNQFVKGAPIYVLLKCDASPHIYRLEGGRKRWIVDIPTFESEGYVWGDVKIVSCEYLHNLPVGDSVPPGRGTPPPPLP